MTYIAGEALVLIQLQAVAGFNDKNTSRGKWGILNSGLNDHYGIVKPGAFTREQAAMSANITTYQTIIQVWQRYKDDGETLTDLESNVDLIIARFDQYRKLADTTNTLLDATLTNGGQVEEMWNQAGGLSWLKQELIITWLEYDQVTYAE